MKKKKMYKKYENYLDKIIIEFFLLVGFFLLNKYLNNVFKNVSLFCENGVIKFNLFVCRYCNSFYSQGNWL